MTNPYLSLVGPKKSREPQGERVESPAPRQALDSAGTESSRDQDTAALLEIWADILEAQAKNMRWLARLHREAKR